MITVIPMREGRISKHFTKADSLLFIDAQGKEISRHANPTLGADCAGKESLLELIVRQGAGRVVVRNIGQEMLGRLLDQQLTVLQARRGDRELADIIASEMHLVALTDASQGSPSIQHEAKQHAGGCGCGGHHHQHHHQKPSHAAGGCCQEQGHGHSHHHEAEHQCCGRHKGEHQQGHGKGHGQCCHP